MSYSPSSSSNSPSSSAVASWYCWYQKSIFYYFNSLLRAPCRTHPPPRRTRPPPPQWRPGTAGTKRAFSTILILYSGLHVVLTLLLVELALLLRSGVLVLLVLGDEIVHVALRLGEL